MNISRNFCLGVGLLIVLIIPGNTFAHAGEESDAEASADLSPEGRAVVTALESFAAAFQASDIEQMHRLTLADGQFSHFEGAFADWSWESYANHLAEEMPLFTDTRYLVTNVRPTTDENIAFATYDWAMDVVVVSEKFEGGRHPVSMSGIGTAVLVKSGTEWKIRHLHTARTKENPAEH